MKRTLSTLSFVLLFCICTVSSNQGSLTQNLHDFAAGFLDFPLRLQEVVQNVKTSLGLEGNLKGVETKQQAPGVVEPSAAALKKEDFRSVAETPEDSPLEGTFLVLPDVESEFFEEADHDWSSPFIFRPLSHLLLRHFLSQRLSAFSQLNRQERADQPEEEPEQNPSVEETEEKVVLTLRIPRQFPPESIKVQWEGRELEVVAQKDGVALRQLVRLPFELKSGEVSAVFEDGVLKLEILKPQCGDNSHSVDVVIKGKGQVSPDRLENEEDSRESQSQPRSLSTPEIKQLEAATREEKRVSSTESQDAGVRNDELLEKIKALKLKEFGESLRSPKLKAKPISRDIQSNPNPFQ